MLAVRPSTASLLRAIFKKSHPGSFLHIGKKNRSDILSPERLCLRWFATCECCGNLQCTEAEKITTSGNKSTTGPVTTNMSLCLVKRGTQAILTNVLKSNKGREVQCRCKFFPVPSYEERDQWLHQYPNPVKTVSTFLHPRTNVDPNLSPSVDFQSSKYMQKNYAHYKATLSFTWPMSFSTTGVGSDINEAYVGAYLYGCRMLESLGLLTSEGDTVPFIDYLMDAKQLAAKRLPCDLWNVKSRCELRKDGKKVWHSEITLNWPFAVSSSDVGMSQEDATKNAAVHIFIKLKAGRYLDYSNRIVQPSRMQLCSNDGDKFSPDYEVYVDSSSVGYGAILYSNDKETKTQDSMVPWIATSWPEDIKELTVEYRDSTMFELYGVLSAIYTWKKKFVGKNVLVYNDNLGVVDMLNHGLSFSSKKKERASLYNKAYKTLRETCTKYSFQLKAQHIMRDLNRPADYLSKDKIHRFRQMVPKAKQVSKKSKKMLFFMPLVEDQSQPAKQCT